MRDPIILLVHLIATLARLMGPGGLRSVVAESVLVKQQLLILNRSRHRAPNLCASDRILAGVCALFSSSPGGSLPRGPHQIRTWRFPPSGSSADVARGSRATTVRSCGDMIRRRRSAGHGSLPNDHTNTGPPLLGRFQVGTRSPASSLVCSPQTPSSPSASAPVVPCLRPTLARVPQGAMRVSQVSGPSSSSVP